MPCVYAVSLSLTMPFKNKWFNYTSPKINRQLLLLTILFFISIAGKPQSPGVAPNAEIDFVSDTQQPIFVEKIKLRANHNIRATSMIFLEIEKNKPRAVYMLGDIVSVGSNNHKWRNVDKFIDSCHKNKIPVYGLLGNHDLMWGKKKGEKNFQKRFPDNIDIGYVSVTDSIAVVMLNSNFKKLSVTKIGEQKKWYGETLKRLDSNNAIKTIIVSCHHAPYSNSLIVGSSKQVQQYFVDPFIQTKKCRLFITGHSHNFEHFKFSGKDFLVIGGGGGLHQPLDTSATRIPDLAFTYKPMFHYLSIQKNENKLLLTSHFLKPDFSGFEKGYVVEIEMQ